MSARTLTLVLLSVLGLGLTAIVLALTQPVAVSSGWSTPWLVPLIAIPTCSAALFFGRRQLLPMPIAASSVRAARTLLLLTSGSMVAAAAAMWAVQRVLGAVRGGFFVALWVALLWLAVDRLQRSAADRSLPP